MGTAARSLMAVVSEKDLYDGYETRDEGEGMREREREERGGWGSRESWRKR